MWLAWISALLWSQIRSSTIYPYSPISHTFTGPNRGLWLAELIALGRAFHTATYLSISHNLSHTIPASKIKATDPTTVVSLSNIMIYLCSYSDTLWNYKWILIWFDLSYCYSQPAKFQKVDQHPNEKLDSIVKDHRWCFKFDSMFFFFLH